MEPDRRKVVAEGDPECVYLEVTNRCNLVCATCPRYFSGPKLHADMRPDVVVRVASQLPGLKRAVLHGIGEPLMNEELPEIMVHLKNRGVNLCFNTNGILLNQRWQHALIDIGLDELRLSLNTSDPGTYARIHRADAFAQVVRNVRQLMELKTKLGKANPKVSLWALALRDTVGQIVDFVRLAVDLGIKEVYLQRLVYHDIPGEEWLARKEQSLYSSLGEDEARAIYEAQSVAEEIGIRFAASGGGGAFESLSPKAAQRPWSFCLRPWTTLYISAEGDIYPCCMALFVSPGDRRVVMGRLSEGIREVWNGAKYKRFREMLLAEAPPDCCSGCGVNWSL